MLTDAQMDPLLGVYPDTPFFKLYFDLVKSGEACPRFHFFTAAATLGALVARRVFFQRGSSKTFPTIYPNPWVILVAPQGAGHKSTALAVGRRIMEGLPDHLRPNILSAKITPEALVKSLASDKLEPEALPGGISSSVTASQATGVLYSSELGVLIGREKYNTGLISLLTDLYDCPDVWSSSTIMRGDNRLYGVCLTVMGASTPEWLQTMLPQDAFKGGFMSRLLLITMPHTWDKRVPCPSPASDSIWDALLTEVARILEYRGRMQFSPEAEIYFNDWYMEFYMRDRFVVPGAVAAYLERRQDHLIRIATLLQLTKHPKRLLIEADTLHQAQAIFNSVDNDTSSIIEFIATEPGMRQAQIVLELLRHHGKLREDQLLKLAWRQLSYPKQFPDIMAMLAKARVVEAIIEGSDLVWCYREG